MKKLTEYISNKLSHYSTINTIQNILNKADNKIAMNQSTIVYVNPMVFSINIKLYELTILFIMLYSYWFLNTFIRESHMHKFLL